MNGFAVSSLNYLNLQDMMRGHGLIPEEIYRIEVRITNHIYSLIEKMSYTEAKDYIEMNNAFKELNVWINEMFTRLSFYDNKGGWEKIGIDDHRRIEEILNREHRYYGKLLKKEELELGFILSAVCPESL